MHTALPMQRFVTVRERSSNAKYRMRAMLCVAGLEMVGHLATHARKEANRKVPEGLHKGDTTAPRISPSTCPLTGEAFPGSLAAKCGQLRPSKLTSWKHGRKAVANPRQGSAQRCRIFNAAQAFQLSEWHSRRPRAASEAHPESPQAESSRPELRRRDCDVENALRALISALGENQPESVRAVDSNNCESVRASVGMALAGKEICSLTTNHQAQVFLAKKPPPVLLKARATSAKL
ncbi:hypothetical protein N431DRAFT_456413 [Stipitochalara longipes BDJ]|nr:hypothetical protein N431DRAFT_456413 [Stipitochalara longipes BDJ]